MMKYLVAAISILVSLPGTSKAETKEEIMDILAKKMEIEDPDNDFADVKTKARQAEFLKTHKQLLDSLGKDEIFYHLELTSALFNESRPGFQPHAVYALYLYSKFHDGYSREENEMIASKIRGFAESGWVPKKDFGHFQAIQSQQMPTNSSASPRESPGYSDKASPLSLESRPNGGPRESAPHITSSETNASCLSMRWPLAAGAIVVALGLLWAWLKKRE